MDKKLKVGIIGATGMVGQNYLGLLAGHPWFEVAYLAASPRSAGKRYRDAVSSRWHMKDDIPEPVRDMVVEDAGNVAGAVGRCRLVFSAVEMEKQAEVGQLQTELELAEYRKNSELDKAQKEAEIQEQQIELSKQNEERQFELDKYRVEQNEEIAKYKFEQQAARERQQMQVEFENVQKKVEAQNLENHTQP